MPARATVTSTDGARLAVHTAGRADAPLVLLVHGWAQSGACWRRQFEDAELTAAFRLAAPDLRGHGESEVTDGGYGAELGDDLHAVLTALGGPALLVGSSYGGLVIAEYLGRHGAANTAGVLLTGALSGLGRGVPSGRVGPAMRAALPAVLSEEPALAQPAMTALVRAMTPAELPETAALTATALGTPARVRAALFARTVDASPHLSGVPLLVQHGSADVIVDRATAEHHLATVPGARADWWEGAGHLPFAEDPARFGRTLLAFARRCALHQCPDGERMTR